MKNPKEVKQILPLVEKMFHHNYEIQTTYWDPAIEVLKATLPISIALLIGSLSLDIKIKYILVNDISINPFLLITSALVILLYLFLFLKANSKASLNKAMKEIYWSEAKPLYKILIEKDLKAFKKVEKEVVKAEAQVEKLRDLLRGKITLPKLILAPLIFFHYLNLKFKVFGLKNKVKSKSKFLANIEKEVN